MRVFWRKRDEFTYVIMNDHISRLRSEISKKSTRRSINQSSYQFASKNNNFRPATDSTTRFTMGLDLMCCEPLAVERETESESSSSTDEILECDYDTQVTKLYHSIEEKQWEDVLYFLETGKWCSSGIFSIFATQEETPAVQARTWVTALDSSGNVRWCQLPLHAAVTFLAPFAVIQKLVETYPKSVRCADDQDMLPLHYAFRFGVEDDVLLYLLEQFPQAISKKAVKDRLPLDLAPFGPRPGRGAIIDYYMQSAVKHAKHEWDNEYEKMVAGMRNVADSELRNNLKVKTTKLVATMAELNRTKKELSGLRQELKEAKRELMKDHESLRSSRSLKRNPSPRSNGSHIADSLSSAVDEEEEDIEAIQAPKKNNKTKIRSLTAAVSSPPSKKDDSSRRSEKRSVEIRDEDSRRSTTRRSVQSSKKTGDESSSKRSSKRSNSKGPQSRKSSTKKDPSLKRGLRKLFGVK